MSNKKVPLTLNFQKDIGSIIGKVDIAPNLLAKSVLRDIDKFTFEPGYIKHDDGTVELVEISAVRKEVTRENNSNK